MIAGSKLVTIEEGSHFLSIDTPEVVAQEISQIM
jgi:pimeloyl-ACP methyl ester carboxylesterase